MFGDLIREYREFEAPSTHRTEILRALTSRPASADLATLIAMAHTDEVVRLLRAIRDLDWQQEWQQAAEGPDPIHRSCK
jgi:hypothetical protein